MRASRVTFIFEPEKYVAARSPVRRRSSATASASSESMIAWVRVSCHTRALCSARPVTASQATVVSRWFVMPMAARSQPLKPAEARARAMTSCVRCQISSASCSTCPGFGRICACSSCSQATARPARSQMMKRVLVVPWSMEPTKFIGYTLGQKGLS